MATSNPPDDALLRQAIRRAADAEFFDGLNLHGELQARINTRIGQEAGRRSWRTRSWWAAGSVAAALALTLVLGPTSARRPGPPPASPSDRPAGDPGPTVKSPSFANPNEDALDERRKVEAPSPSPVLQSQGRPLVRFFEVDVHPTGGTMPAAGALPDLLAGPVVILQPGATLPVRLTWRASGRERYQVDLVQSQWEIVSSNGERQPQPLRIVSGARSLTFDDSAPLSLAVTVQAPKQPGWYTLFLTPRARSDGQNLVQGSAIRMRLFVSYPTGTVRTGDVVPDVAGASESREGITLRIERVRMTELMTEVDYRITLATDTHGTLCSDALLAWDGGEWVPAAVVLDPQCSSGPDRWVRSITAQAIFPPTPRATGRLQVRVPSVDIAVPTGGPYRSLQTHPGPWVVAVGLPAQP